MGLLRPRRVTCRGIAACVARLREPDERGDALYLGGELAHLIRAAREEVALQIEVLGRIAGDAELAEDDEVGPFVLRSGDPVAHEGCVLVNGADRRVDLRERDFEASL